MPDRRAARTLPPEYIAPQVRTYGTLTEMTQNVLSGARVATGGSMRLMSSPIGGGGGTPTTPTTPTTPVVTPAGNTPASTPGTIVPGGGGAVPPAAGAAPATGGAVPGTGGVAGTTATGTSPGAAGTTPIASTTGGATPDGQGVAGVQASGGSSPDSGVSPATASGGGVDALTATGTTPGGGNLPFTGFPAAFVAALGAGMIAGGAAIRRRVSRS